MTKEEPLQDERVIGTYGERGKGPLLIAIGAIHGNEQAGILALERLFAYLEKEEASIKGYILGLKGHKAALETGVRFVDKDLNRLWTPERIEHIRQSTAADLQLVEEKEMYELLRVIDELSAVHKDVLMIDLHTTSAAGGMFSLSNDLQSGRDAASSIGVPVITGLSAVLKGTTMHYFEQMGYPGIAFEGGQHYADSSVDHILAALLRVMFFKKMIPHIPHEFVSICEQMRVYGEPLPRIVEFCYRQAVEPSDSFQMMPGYTNFQPVKEGEFLAFLNGEDVLCPCDGLILMPLYQNQGEDGFFIVQEVKSN